VHSLDGCAFAKPRSMCLKLYSASLEYIPLSMIINYPLRTRSFCADKMMKSDLCDRLCKLDTYPMNSYSQTIT